MKRRVLGAAIFGFLVGISEIPDVARLLMLALLIVYAIAIDLDIERRTP